MRKRLSDYPATVTTVLLLVGLAIVAAAIALWSPAGLIFLGIFAVWMIGDSIRRDRRQREKRSGDV